jgi:hypothetical protein
MLVSSALSNSVLMYWDVVYPNNKFEPPQDYKLEAVDTYQNRVLKENNYKIVDT